MIHIGDFLSIEGILTDVKPTSKRRVLQTMSLRAAMLTHLDEHLILQTLLEREQLGSTTVRNGIAIPRAKIRALEKMTGLFARLTHPIPFDPPHEPVDIIFMLLTPDDGDPSAIEALWLIARQLSNTETIETIRLATRPAQIHALLTGKKQENFL